MKEQLTLGELIKLIEESPKVWSTDREDVVVRFDFGSAIPNTIDSSRGDYSELAIGYRLTGYDSHKGHHVKMTVKEFLDMLYEAVDKTYTGWKGGEFLMDEDTALWVDNSGNWSNTGIHGIYDNGYEIVLETFFIKD